MLVSDKYDLSCGRGRTGTLFKSNIGLNLDCLIMNFEQNLREAVINGKGLVWQSFY